MKLKKLSVRKKSVSPNLDSIDDFNDDEICSNDDKTDSPVQRNTANARERARMRVLSSAFYKLKTIIPWVPHDTKLSKLDTLRLARNYIAYLSATLDGHPVNEITNKMPHPQKMTWPYIFPQQLDKITVASSKENSKKSSDSIHLMTSTCGENFQKFTQFDSVAHHYAACHEDFDMNYE